MKKGIIILLLTAFVLFFHWKWHSFSIGLNAMYSEPLGNYLNDGKPEDEQPILTLETHKLEIPWTRYLPFFQFGIIEGEQAANITYKEKIGAFSSVSLKDETHRFAVIPEFFIRSKIEEKMTNYLVEKSDGLNGHHFEIK